MVNLHVVIIEPEYGDNLGLIARVIKNFGAEGLVLVNPKIEIEDARQRAMHAQDILDNTLIVNDWSIVRKKFSYLVGSTAKPANEYNVNRASLFPWEIPNVKNMALVIGRESNGLTNKELEECDAIVRIPTSPLYRTMNITHAVAVLLYEMTKEKEKKTIAAPILRTQIYSFWEALLNKLKYPINKKRIQTLLFKRTLERAALTSREAHGIAGVLSKTLKQLTPKD